MPPTLRISPQVAERQCRCHETICSFHRTGSPTGITSRYNLFTFDDIVAALSDVTFAERSTLIGGQALNYWCHQLLKDNPQLEAFAPFASKDVDVIGTYEDAEALARGLGG